MGRTTGDRTSALREGERERYSGTVSEKTFRDWEQKDFDSVSNFCEHKLHELHKLFATTALELSYLR